MPAKPDEPESVALLRSMHDGDSYAMGSLLERHLSSVRAFVRLRVGPEIRARESTSDIVQSVCREVLERADTFDFRGESSFKNWLYGAVLNKVRSRQRHYHAECRDVDRERPLQRDDSGVLRAVSASACQPDRAAIAAEEWERVEAAFDELPEEQREVVSLTRIAGLSHAEVGEKLGKKPEAVRQILHRALVRLSTILTRGS